MRAYLAGGRAGPGCAVSSGDREDEEWGEKTSASDSEKNAAQLHRQTNHPPARKIPQREPSCFTKHPSLDHARAWA